MRMPAKAASDEPKAQLSELTLAGRAPLSPARLGSSLGSGRVAHLHIRQERQQEEEPGEDVATFGHPCDGLGAERVERKEERRGDRTGASRTVRERRGFPEQMKRQEVEDHGIRRVDDEARQVVAHGVHVPQDIIQAEGEPRERDVVAHEEGGEEVLELRRPEPTVVLVQGQIDLIIPLDELVPEGG